MANYQKIGDLTKGYITIGLAAFKNKYEEILYAIKWGENRNK